MSRHRCAFLVIGGTGQIGRELLRALPQYGCVRAPSHADLDIRDPGQVRDAVGAMRPRIVINAAAYTNVDRAETDGAACRALNADAPAVLAEACRDGSAALVHFSTDYVFDGTGSTPYGETDEARPATVYGQTKLDGERAVAATLPAHLVLRTSWIYATHGRSFPRTIRRLASERSELPVVNDQTGSPTSARHVAHAVARILGALVEQDDPLAAAEEVAGTYHLTASGATTWYEFASIVLSDRLAERGCARIRPISTLDYGAPAPRPRYSVLDNAKVATTFGIRLPDWREQWDDTAALLREEIGEQR